jgi:hypothetical protein
VDIGDLTATSSYEVSKKGSRNSRQQEWWDNFTEDVRVRARADEMLAAASQLRQ